jgi:hypothetical protein
MGNRHNLHITGFTPFQHLRLIVLLLHLPKGSPYELQQRVRQLYISAYYHLCPDSIVLDKLHERSHFQLAPDHG